VRASPRPELLAAPASPAAAGAGVEVVFLPDARVHDGAFANNAWLQELPDPVTTLTWDNAAHLSARTAQRLGVETGDVLTLRAGGGGREVQLPALVVPGHAEETVSLRVGYGRSGAETVARGVGTSVYPLRPAGAPYRLAGVAVARAPGAARHALALTQHHWSLEGRDVARTTTLAALQSATPAQPPRARRALTLYEPPAPGAGERPAQQWAMTIDLSACTGCGACVVACQAENNVPVVGRDDVLEGREMHWLRVDRYVAGPADPPAVVSQPMLCQHCEKAPCEYVCPVEATVHSPDGLNEMVYNRCVGTRFCSNNCPYKVRRFNWFDYNRRLAETEAMARNPDVTVRERGVMEKCTFCVQRIREAEIAAELDRRPLAGDEVRTACQQACPAQAIVFGSLTDARSEVARLREDRRAYAALGELGTEPRVRYLARVTNPNPELGDAR
jgi:molybdopterin-containing oxidoreductase family iron-sulfur binding subunit